MRWGTKEREKERERVCVCVCERERERERERQREGGALNERDDELNLHPNKQTNGQIYERTNTNRHTHTLSK